MAKISKVIAHQILDSRGEPTIETKIVLDNGTQASDSVPSGASKGSLEAIELRDNIPTQYSGESEYNAVNIVNNIIAPKLIGVDPTKQLDIDRMMIAIDGTPNKSKLGANSILSVSMAIARASSQDQNIPLYQYIQNLYTKALGGKLPPPPTKISLPLFNIINGGQHGAGNLNFQEFLLIPASDKTYKDGLRLGDEIYYKLKEVLIFRNTIHSVGDEGGFAPNLSTNIDALEAIAEAIRSSNYRLGVDVFLGLDLAANYFFRGGRYQLIDRTQPYTSDEFIDYLLNLQKDYKLLLFEDPFEENEWESWVKFTEKIGDQVFVVGDDLLVTNPDRLRKATEKKACNSILVKLNQIGTLTETLEVINQARNADFKVIISHRSGETTDSFIADLAVATAADYAKFGAPARGERVVKYNRLLEIEEEISSK